MKWQRHEGHAIDLLSDWDRELDLVVTDPPYAFGGGSGSEHHKLSATVAIVLRETARKLKRGCWLVCYTATSWRAISYVVEACRNIVEPVRIATWTKPCCRTKVQPIGWSYASVALVAMRKGPKNDPRLMKTTDLDHIEAATAVGGRRAQLPETVASWSVAPFVIPGGLFLDPFAGSGTLPAAAAHCGMEAHGFEILEEPDYE